jgi:hypothetical protein
MVVLSLLLDPRLWWGLLPIFLIMILLHLFLFGRAQRACRFRARRPGMGFDFGYAGGLPYVLLDGSWMERLVNEGTEFPTIG